MKRMVVIGCTLASACNLFSPVDNADGGPPDMPGSDVPTSPADMAGALDMPLDSAGGTDTDVPDADAAPMLPDDWWDVEWPHRISVQVDESQLEPASGVPLPIRVPADFVSLSAEATDLRVVDANGDLVPFEVSRWGADGIVWALLDVDPAREGPDLRLYVGRPNTNSVANPAEVWSGFHAAFHFDGDELGANSVEDGWTVQESGAPAAAPGLVGTALDAGAGSLRFPAVAQTMRLDLEIDGQATFFVCLNTGFTEENQTLIWKEGGCEGWSLHVTSSGNPTTNLRHSSDDCNDWLEDRVVSATPVNDEGWHCLASRMDRVAGVIDLIVDAQPAQAAALDNTRDATGGQFRIGNNYNDSRPMLGLIDEVWIAEGRIPDSWVRAVHTFLLGDVVVVGEVESLPE